MVATVTTNQINHKQQFGGSPFGNSSRLKFNLTTDASGIALNTDQATAMAATDVVRLGVIPAGFTMDDCLATISVAFAAGTTCSLGFAYVDGVDVTAAPQDAAYLIAATQSLATAAVVRKTGIKAPLTLPKDAYLILTMAVAAQTGIAVLDVSVLGVATGGN